MKPLSKMEAYHYLCDDRGETAFLANNVLHDTYQIHRPRQASRLKVLAYLKTRGATLRLAPFTNTELLVNDKPVSWKKIDRLWQLRSTWR